MLRIGLTGGIGSVKTVVAEHFKRLDVPVIDADAVSHQITAPGSESLAEIRDKLGGEFITPGNTLDRKKLADYVFRHPEKKSVLENILHPKIRQQMLHEIEKAGDTAYIILVVPLLFETNFIELVDRVLVVDAPEDIRISRVMRRDGRSEQEIRAILRNQLDQSVKTEKADDVLDNSSDPEHLQSAVESLHNQYLEIANRRTSG